MRPTHFLQKVSPVTRIEAYRRIHGLTFEQLGERIGRSGFQAQRYCKPRSDPKHNRPGWDCAEALDRLTYGVIHAGNYAEELTLGEAAVMIGELARREAAASAGGVA